jgi:glycerophosphoryl diester phosphodiesterase
MTYDSIRKYDVGLKPHPDFPRQKKIAAYKPLLEDLISATEAHVRKNDKSIFYNIEIKSKPENDGKKHPPIEEFVDLVVNAITKKRILNRTIIQSFDQRPLQIIYRKYPSATIALLIDGTDKKLLDEHLQNLGFTPHTYSPHYSLVTPELIQECHKKNMKIIPWTVNDLQEIKRLKEMGVDGIITDYPDMFLQLSL